MDANEVQSKTTLECAKCGHKIEQEEYRLNECESCGSKWEEIRHAHITLPSFCINTQFM
jgi:Zn finger protein HypA/HybF involved in hydrogenase expression